MMPSSSMTTSPAPFPAARYWLSSGVKSLSCPLFCTSTLMFGFAASKALTASSKPGVPKYCNEMVTGPELLEPPEPSFFLLHAAMPRAKPAESATAATERRRREVTLILTPLSGRDGGGGVGARGCGSQVFRCGGAGVRGGRLWSRPQPRERSHETGA